MTGLAKSIHYSLSMTGTRTVESLTKARYSRAVASRYTAEFIIYGIKYGMQDWPESA